MREVDDAFRAVDDEFFFNETVEKANAALHDAENRVTRERLKQKAKLFTARATATILAASFMIATFYLLTYLKKTWESSNRIIELDQVVSNQRAHISILGDKVEATVDDLRQSREAADASFYGMTQSAEGGQAEASLIKQLAGLRTYYLEILKEAAEREEAAAERGRALHSLALIEKRMSRVEEAVDHFGKAIATFEDLLKESGPSSRENRRDMMMRLADSYENVAILNDSPVDGEVTAALSRAVWFLKQVLAIAPDDPMVADRLADCSFRLGQILEEQNQFEAAIGSYSEAANQVVQLRRQAEDCEKVRHYDEMIARLQFHAAVSLRRVGRIDEATESFIAAIESVEKIREIEGYSLEQKLMKARSFLALGDIFSSEESIDVRDKDQVYNEALRLIAPLNRDTPDDVGIAILMSQSLKRLAQLELEANHWRDGYNLSVRGIETLSHALETNEDHFMGYIELAEARLDHLRFLINDMTSARRISLRGVDNATRAHDLFLEAAPDLCDQKREGLAARLRGLFSSYQEACLRLGQQKMAEECSEYAAFKLSYQD